MNCKPGSAHHSFFQQYQESAKYNDENLTQQSKLICSGEARQASKKKKKTTYLNTEDLAPF